MRSVPLILGLADGQHRLGHRRRRGADSVQRVRRNRVQSRPGRPRASSGAAPGVGLLCGGALAYTIGPPPELHAITSAPSSSATWCTAASYILFSQMRSFAWALVFIALSRAGRRGQLRAEYVAAAAPSCPTSFAAASSPPWNRCTWSVMMVSMTLAGIASQYWDPRTIGAIAGALSSTTAIFWGWAHLTGRLPEPAARRRGAGGDRSPWRARP